MIVFVGIGHHFLTQLVDVCEDCIFTLSRRLLKAIDIVA